MKRKMLLGTRAAGTDFTATVTTVSKNIQSAVQSVEGVGVVFRIKTGTRNGSGVMDADIYDSEDGLTFTKVASFTQITAEGDNFKLPGRSVAAFVRLVLTLTSGTGFSACRAWVEYFEDRSSGRPAGGVTET